MKSLSALEISMLKDVASLPTAPFHERHVQAYVQAWAKTSGIGFERDRSGNILLTYSGKGRPSADPWVLQAHMDHPGFEVISRRGRSVQAWFRGGVLERYFPDARVCFFPAGGNSVCGTVRSAKRDKESGFLLCRIQLDAAAELAEGSLGMWDLEPWRRRGNRLSLRVVDDLCGVAAVLTTLARIQRQGGARRVYGLLTRAEEVGFVGAMAAVKNRLIDPAWPVLGIEASKAQPNAKLGQGAIIRVGDASTIFNPALTAVLRKTARALQLKNESFRFVESLMPGGNCESTGLGLMGYQTCAVCLPLGHYHNMGKEGIAPEQIDVRDYESLVALLAEVVQNAPDASHQKEIRKRLSANYKKRSPLL